jgi:hypothetical protein
MGGGLLQLVAYGSQDVYLTGQPQITFFKVVYRRHTNFALESIEQTFNGTVGFGRRVTCTVSRNGDLLTKTYLRVQLPTISVKDNAGVAANTEARWVDHVGHRLIKFVEVEIGGQRIDKHYGEWLHIWNELTQTSGHAIGYNRMIGHHPMFQTITTNSAATPPTHTVAGDTLYIPFCFWFNRNPGLALPLIALQYHEVKFNIEFADLAEVCPAAADSANVDMQGDLTASLFVDYVYLDADERKRFAQVTHEYLIEQLQFTGSESVGAYNGVGSHKAKLNFNHPCKELIWTVRDGAAEDTGTHGLKGKLAPFNYAIGGGTGTPTGGDMDLAGPGGGSSAMASLMYGEKNPVKSALLQLNGHDRFSRRDGMYFNVVQPYQHHENVPPSGINVYSFALKPEEHQPSGSCNMSRIDNAVLQLELEPLPNGGQISVFATNYNVLRVLSGMGGIAYASITSITASAGVASIATKLMNVIFTGFGHSFGR